jgi:hypothetical protein
VSGVQLLVIRCFPMEIHDPIFGRLTYENGLWAFIPKEVVDGFMISIDAPETGPSAAQRDYFLDISSRLSKFEQLGRDFIDSHSEFTGDVACLSTYSIEVGTDLDCQRQRFVLEMSDNDAAVIHRVTFFDGEPLEYWLDD